MAKALVCRVGQLLYLIPVADVAGLREGAPACLRLHFFRKLLAGIELAAGDHDVGARVREAEHHLLAEPTAAARDERDLAEEGLAGWLRHDGHLSYSCQRYGVIT